MSRHTCVLINQTFYLILSDKNREKSFLNLIFKKKFSIPNKYKFKFTFQRVVAHLDMTSKWNHPAAYRTIAAFFVIEKCAFSRWILIESGAEKKQGTLSHFKISLITLNVCALLNGANIYNIHF